MSMRIFSASLAALALASCGSGGEGETLEEVEAAARERQADNGMIGCAVNGTGEFAEDCTVDRTQGDEGLVLTIRHPDGGFRRLLVTTDGRGVIAADGAEEANVSPVSEGLIEVEVGGDRYRLPATVR